MRGGSDIEHVFESILSILNYMKVADTSIMTMVEESSTVMVEELSRCKNGSFSDELTQAIQKQDLISQQMCALNNAVSEIEQSLTIYLHASRTDHTILGQSLEKLQLKLVNSLEEARKKQDSLMGKTKDSTENSLVLEFF